MFCALLVHISAFGLVHPVLLGHRVFHRTRILPSHLVIRNPAVLRGTLAIGREFGFVVNLALRIVIFHPTDVAQVAHVHVQALEGDAGGDDSVEFVDLRLGVEQAVAQGWQVEGFCLGAGDLPVALQAGEVAPEGGGEQVAELVSPSPP